MLGVARLGVRRASPEADDDALNDIRYSCKRSNLFGYVRTIDHTEYIKTQSELMLEAITVLDQLGIIGKISAAD